MLILGNNGLWEGWGRMAVSGNVCLMCLICPKLAIVNAAASADGCEAYLYRMPG
ncbi:hypothetical protein H6F43_20310 [Leptolyngbya sp. FACHB-36]|uniref:hypothetical protein n=1 Tax=Leptolyngbya sp. FACHB-36 TaxID=2692808 RepID=UPI0016809D40|nr:hypothetical protein [Leptolyngbya sp. FACHB-36]MBD2022528.1 hypothetical protein [Leptolyngbya sp. FACHB-36]